MHSASDFGYSIEGQLPQASGQPTSRYEVVNWRTGERFGNHTFTEAGARARTMERNWQYKERFGVVEILS